jgi:DNA-binding NarL/FixJ family response regulator
MLCDSRWTGPHATPTHVLHVDDDPAFLGLLRSVFGSQTDDVRVVSVESPDSGLERLRSDETTIDCVLSDYDMPGANGLEFLQRVRDVDSRVPFILYTGRRAGEIADEAVEAGVDGYVRKDGRPGHFVALANQVRSEVTRARTEPETKRR